MSVKALMHLAGQTGRASIEGLLQSHASKLVMRAESVPELFARLDSDGGLLTIPEVFDDRSEKQVDGLSASVNPAPDQLTTTPLQSSRLP